MANYTKNILVGAGGSGIINKSHMLGALYGMERIMGRDKPRCARCSTMRRRNSFQSSR